jgi:uncharacterized membrane protein
MKSAATAQLATGVAMPGSVVAKLSVMSRSQLEPAGDSIDVRVTIRRPVADVFKFYKDLRNLPLFVGDVMDVQHLGPGMYQWTVQGPLGMRMKWRVLVTNEVTNRLIRYETITAPELRTSWEVRFAPGPDANQTEVHERMTPPLGRVGRAALALIGKPPGAEVRANLQRLKELLETGHVSDTTHAAAGKFEKAS